MAQRFYEPADQYDDEIGEYDDGNYYDGEGTPLHGNLRNSASYNPFDDNGARHDLEPYDRLDGRHYDNQNSISGRQSSQNWSSSNQSFSTYQQQQRPPPLLEGFDDNEGPWADEGIGGGEETKVGKGSASKANSMKWKIILAVSVVALGAIGGIVYWTTLKGSPSAVSANAGATNTGEPDGSEGSGNSTNSEGDNSTNVNSIVAEPPQLFDETCSRKSVSGDPTNFQDCEVMCGDAVCCYVGDNETTTGTDSCFEENKEICGLYSPLCDFLFGPLIVSSNPADNTSASVIKPAPDDLLSSCGTNGSVAECMDACYDGYCCFSSAPLIMDGANQTLPSCYEQSACDGYLPCLAVVLSSLSPTNETDELPNPPDDLSELCSEDSLTTQVGAVRCMSHCSKALCCIDVNASNTCIDENIAKCTRYSPCSRILQGMLTDNSNVELHQTVEERLPLPPPELGEVCNPDYFSLVENRTACAFECEAALCCYSDVGGCLQDELETCLAYFPCQALVDYLGDGGNLTKPPANLTTNCDAESRTTKAGRRECLKDCFPGLCCYHPKNSCFEDNIFTCLAYSPCEPIIDLDDGTFKGIVPLLNASLDNTTASEVPPPPPDLPDICSIESLSSVKGVAACFGACTDSMCCISDEENCYDSNSKNCDLYEPCLNLLYSPAEADNTSVPTGNTTAISLDPPPDNLDSMCDPDRAFTSQKCRLACETAACCFSSEGSCRRKQSKWCETYSPCEVFQNSGGDPVNNTIVRKQCKPTAFEKNDKPCKNVCREGACCFVNVSDPASCASNNGFCEYYKPCAILNGEKAQGQLNTTNKTVSVSRVCDFDPVLNDTDVREKCVDACHGWECCFLDRKNKRSCHKDVAFCQEYTPCLVLSPFTNASLSLEHVCLASNGKFTEVHNMACKSLCEAGSCCLIAKGDPNSCAHKPDFCSAFDACAVLSESKSSASPSFVSSTRKSSQSLAPSVSPSPTSVNYTSELIRKICDETNTSSGVGREECLNVCREGSCCFLDEAIPESCANETDFCTDYQPCALLVGADPDNSTSGGGSNSSVHRACSGDSLSTPSGVAKCTALCEEGSCCLEPIDSADSCRSDTDFCVQFKSCKSLAAWNDTKPPAANATGKSITTTEGSRYTGDPSPKSVLGIETPPRGRACTQDSIDSMQLVPCFEMCTEWACCYDSIGCTLNRVEVVPCEEVRRLCLQIIDIQVTNGHTLM